MKIFILILMLTFSLYSKTFFSNDEQKDASEYMGALKDLIIATQKTRGATYGYHKGNTSSLLLIYNYRRDMKKAIGTMESLPLSSEVIINTRATAISQRLIKLNRMALKLEANSSFEQYTENIEQSLMLAQTVSKKSFDNLSSFGKHSAEIMLESILPLTENIGQLRAKGTGAAAEGNIEEQRLYEMKALIEEIKRLNNKFQSDTRYNYKNNTEHFKTDVELKLNNIQKDLDGLISLTKNKIFKKNIKVNPDKYFQKATDIISEIVQIFDINNKAILADSKGWL